MAKKQRGLSSKAIPRGLSASLAGLRAGGALAVDSAVQRVIGRKSSDGDSEFARREARRFVAELGKLKGTYIKIGQMMALFGEHFLPPALAEAMHDLGDQTEPLHWDALESSVRASLGARFDELDIDPEAIAAASLAQVHLAQVCETGEWICLKVQYPGLSDVIDSDFDTVVRMLLLARWVKAGRDLDDWLESMRTHLHHEIDYQREARLTRRMGELVQGVEVDGITYHVPAVHEHYCTDTVLALEYMEGYSVTDERVAALSQERRNALARGMLRCVGATTLNEYRKYIEKDAALERRFQPVLVREPSVEDTVSILRGLKEKYEVHHGVRIKDSAIVAAAALSQRYIADRFLPDKAIDLIDECASKLRIEIDSMPVEINEIQRKILQAEIEREWDAMVKANYAKEPSEKLENEMIRIAAVLEKLERALETDRVYLQEGLTIGTLARQLGASEHVLRHVINRGMGYRNFNDFLHAWRIREACEELSRPEHARQSVLAIAMKVGYGSIGAFNRAFKERIGMTPTAYRRKSAGEASVGAAASEGTGRPSPRRAVSARLAPSIEGTIAPRPCEPAKRSTIRGVKSRG